VGGNTQGGRHLRDVRILVGYNCSREGVDKAYERLWELLRLHGHDVRGFCLTINPPGPRMSFNALDHAWRSGDPLLLKHLDKLERALCDRDVLINWHGANLPPEFVQQLPVHTVFVCNDDPESSYDLSRPAAWAYDQAFVGNVAAVDSYRDWGCTRVQFLPMGFTPWSVFPGLSESTLKLDRRDIDVVFFGERVSPWRQDRLDRLRRAFPKGVFRGRGWPEGFVSREEMLATYQRSKIGINIHNSTGPINFRLYQLPANGVMQICDNKANLAAVFEPGKEIVGFDTIGECIDLVRYYLEHDEERAEIALAGFRRAHRDYNICAVWKRLEIAIEREFETNVRRLGGCIDIAQRQLAATRPTRVSAGIKRALLVLPRTAKKLLKSVFQADNQEDFGSAPAPREEDYADVLRKYYVPPIERVGTPSLKIGILTDFQGEHENYRRACEELDVPYQMIDFTSDRWLLEVKRAACDGYVVHPNHWLSVWKEMFDERLRLMSRELGLRVCPRPEDVWIYEGKRRLAYWLQAHDIPHPETHIFYDRDEARDYLLRASYPIVYKTHVGSAASGVVILRDYGAALSLLDRAFGEGIIRSPGDRRDRSWGYVLFQEYLPNVREFRIIKIGRSWFGHEKLKQPGTEFYSGSGEVGWGVPPMELFDFCYHIGETAGFFTMCFDVFLTIEGRILVNELHVVFGSYNPSQMYIDGKPGRYLRRDDGWVFQEGLFNRNGSANLRLIEFLDLLESNKVRKDGLKK